MSIYWRQKSRSKLSRIIDLCLSRESPLGYLCNLFIIFNHQVSLLRIYPFTYTSLRAKGLLSLLLLLIQQNTVMISLPFLTFWPITSSYSGYTFRNTCQPLSSSTMSVRPFFEQSQIISSINLWDNQTFGQEPPFFLCIKTYVYI